MHRWWLAALVACGGDKDDDDSAPPGGTGPTIDTASTTAGTTAGTGSSTSTTTGMPTGTGTGAPTGTGTGAPTGTGTGAPTGTGTGSATTSAVAPTFTDLTRTVLGTEHPTEVFSYSVITDLFGTGGDDLVVNRHAYHLPVLYQAGPTGFIDRSDVIEWPPEDQLFVTQDPIQVVPGLHLRDQTPWSDRHGVSGADLDGDGDVDLALMVGGGSSFVWGLSQLYENRGTDLWPNLANLGGTDRWDIPSASGAIYPHAAFEDPLGNDKFALWVDLDGDDDLDAVIGRRVHGDRPIAEGLMAILHTGRATPPWFDPDYADAKLTEQKVHAGAALAFDPTHRCAPPPVWVTPRLGANTFFQECDTPADCEMRVCGLEGEDFVCHDGGPSTFEALTLAAGDVDGDLVLDLILGWNNGEVEAYSGHDLSWGSGTLTLGPPLWTLPVVGVTGLVVQDFDNDGYLDIYAGSQAAGERGKVFYGPSRAAVDLHPWPGDTVRAKASWGDFDGDGRVDLALGTDHTDSNVKTLFNRTETGDNCWLDVRLKHTGTGEVANTPAIGARVRVDATGADGHARTWLGTVQSGGSWRTELPHYVHFGLGRLEGGCSAAEVTVTVDWPIVDDACAQTIHPLVGVNRRVRLED